MNELLKPLGTGRKILTEKEVLDEIDGINNPAKTPASLEQKIQRAGIMPKIRLNEISNTFVRVPTKDEYVTLMQIYECRGWKWFSESSPIDDLEKWGAYKEETAVKIGNNFTYSEEPYLKRAGHELISFQEFCQKQGITQSTIEQIKNYFEGKK